MPCSQLCYSELNVKSIVWSLIHGKGMIGMKKQTSTGAKKYDEKRFTKIDIIKTRRSSAFYLNFLPEQHMRPHTHPERELYLHVIEGTGTLFVDDDTVTIVEGDVIYCDPDEMIGFTNTGSKSATLYGVMTKIS